MTYFPFLTALLPSGQIAVDKFGRNTVRSSIIVDYDEKAVTNVVAPLFAAKTEHLYPIPTANSNKRNKQVPTTTSLPPPTTART